MTSRWLAAGRITPPRLDDGPGVVFGMLTCLVLFSIALVANIFYGIVIFYALPVGLAAWLFGRTPGIAAAAFATVATVSCGLFSPHQPQVLPVSLPALVLVSVAIIAGIEWGRQNERLLSQIRARERRRGQMLDMLTKVGHELVEARRVDAIAEHVLASLARDLELDVAWMFQPEARDAGTLTLLACSGDPPPVRQLPSDAGITGWAFTHAQVVRAPSPEVSLARAARMRPAPAERGIESRLALPVFVRGRLFGVVLLGWRGPRPWEEEEVATATAVVNQLGLAMENVHAQRAALDAMSRLEQLNQMKSDFLKTVSHELRTPLTVVAGYVDLMREGSLGAVPEGWDQPLFMLHAKMQELNRLVGMMLEAARAEGATVGVHLEDIDLVQVVALAVEAEAAGLARSGRELRFDSPVRSMPVRADRDKLLVVLRNLIENAVKYSPSGEPVDVGVAANDDTARVWVADRGIGITDLEKGRIFDQFYRVERAETTGIGGTGIGLFIVRNLMELQGGRVRVDDRSGGGTVFSFVIPRRPVVLPGTQTVEPVPVELEPAGAGAGGPRSA